MVIIQKLLKNHGGYSMKPTSITIHETGNFAKGADALMHSRYLHNKKSGATWHFTVDDKRVVQNLPLDVNSWHAGDGFNGKGNRTSISIEMCVDKGSDYEKTLKNTIGLVRKLLKENLDLKEVVQHNYWKSKKYPNGKNCPRRLRREKRWEWFKEQCFASEHWAEEYYTKLERYGVKLSDKRFDDKITRGEAFALACKVMEADYNGR